MKIETINEYRISNDLTWPWMAERWGASSRQHAMHWRSAGMLIITDSDGVERMVSVRRERENSNDN